MRYEPSAPEVVEAMLQLAAVRADDVVYDLGCGDGRIVIAAAKRGVRGVCVDIDPQRIAESRENARKAGVAERIEFVEEDLMKVPLANATVVMLFLSPHLNRTLRPRLQRELPPGARVVSHWHSMGDWPPQRTLHVKPKNDWRGRPVYLWVIPSGPRPG